MRSPEACADMLARQARKAGHRGGAAPWWRRAGRSRACPRPRAPSSASTAATRGRCRSQSSCRGRRLQSCRQGTRLRARGCRSPADSPRLRGATSAPFRSMVQHLCTRVRSYAKIVHCFSAVRCCARQPGHALCHHLVCRTHARSSQCSGHGRCQRAAGGRAPGALRAAADINNPIVYLLQTGPGAAHPRWAPSGT